MGKLLIDSLLTSPIRPVFATEWQASYSKTDRAFKDKLSRAKVLVGDEVAQYIYTGTDQEEWGSDDFPTMTPPAPVTWIEWKRPSHSISNKCGFLDESMMEKGYPSQAGVLIETASMAQIMNQSRENIAADSRRTGQKTLRQMEGFLAERLVKANGNIDQAVSDMTPTEKRLFQSAVGFASATPQMVNKGIEGVSFSQGLVAYLFLMDWTDNVRGPAFVAMRLLDHNGSVMDRFSYGGILGDFEPLRSAGNTIDLGSLNGLLHPAFLACSWWNRFPDNISERVRKKRVIYKVGKPSLAHL